MSPGKSSEHCPLCGAALASATLRWDAETRTVIRGNAAVTFSPREARLFDLLWHSRGKEGVTRARIFSRLWGGDDEGGPLNADNTISVMFVQMRAGLERVGLAIPKLRKKGGLYRLVDTRAR